MFGTIFFKHVYSAYLNKIRNIFWGARSKLQGQIESRSKIWFLEIQ